MQESGESANGLKRTLGKFNLITLGIGAIIGAGIFVLTGQAAANYAGPAVSLSFVVAGFGTSTFAESQEIEAKSKIDKIIVGKIFEILGMNRSFLVFEKS